MEERLIVKMEELHLDGYFVARPVNVRYISGYTGADSALLITKNKKYFITDPRYTEQVSYECPDYEIINWRAASPSLAAGAGAVAAAAGLKALGFEGDFLTYGAYADLTAAALGVELVNAGGIIEEFRSVKTAQEIEYQRAACEISSRAFERIIKEIRVGVTEKELAAKLSLYMVMEGADTQPYGNILISGARTSLLHGIPSSRAIEYGDFVLMDYGCQVHGYMSDMTRTVVVGKATEKQREVYRLEQQMVAACESVMKAGVAVKDVYEASLGPIRNTEYYPYHYSGIGHGIGMFVHEVPFMGPKPGCLKAGQVVTVEPGIYIPGWGGVRIEDQVLITEHGIENMVSATKELIEL